MKKFKVYVSLGCILAIFACSENSGTSPDKIEDNTPFGWLEGGFTPETRFDHGGGLQKVAHSGDWIVLMDAWTSPVDSNETPSLQEKTTFLMFIWAITVNPTGTFQKLGGVSAAYAKIFSSSL